MKTVCITMAEDGSFSVSELPAEIAEMVGYDKGQPAGTIDEAMAKAKEMLGAGAPQDAGDAEFAAGYNGGQPPMGGDIPGSAA